MLQPASRAARVAALLAAVTAAGGAAPRSVHAANQPSFTGVGDLPGGAYDSVAEAVSADGTVVVGGSESTSGPEAFRWTLAGGIAGLGDLPGGSFSSHAIDVSAAGSVIVGTGVDSASTSRAFRWTAGGGMVGLNQFGCLGCPPDAFGYGVSSDGLVVVGAGAQQIFVEGVSLDAARWAGGGTSISNLGHLSGGGQASEALGATANGSLVVGDSDSSAGVQAFRWTSSGGMVALPGIPGAQVRSGATDVSDDGAVIVGFANAAASGPYQDEAVRWLAPGYSSAQLLGDLPGASPPGSHALAVSPDGSLVVGRANDAGGDETAFVWDAAHGTRALASVLAEEYGLDLGGWRLVDARGISAVNGSGEFTIVGQGINPSGDPEGYVAVLSPTACNDGIDNDGDGLVDYPADPGCTAKGDRSETPDCGDGIDNDGDGLVDYPADPGCTSATDATERFDCEDGIDDDGDGLVDYPADPGCRTPTSGREDPACSNGIDDDGNGAIDFPADPGCLAADDLSEGPDCSDGIDNDGDGLVDFPADPDCTSATDPAEDPQCDDRVDQDRNGRRDYPEDYPACTSAADPIEAPACSDGIDDDGDGLVDYPADPGCPTPGFESESPVHLALNDLLVLDRRSRSLFALDVATGAQTPLSTAAQLTAPQGLAVLPSGAVVVADPAGLFEVAPSTGVQRRFTDPLTAGGSLPVVFDAAGGLRVLEASQISQVSFVHAGSAAKTPLLALPVPGLSIFLGGSLAREASGSLLVGGFGTLGDGIFRVSADGTSVTKVTPGFSGDTWNDLVIEANGTILAAGVRFGVGPGLFRIDPSSGAVTALASGAGWVSPQAVAEAPDGAIYAADAGTCDANGCTGATVAQVDPTSGARLHVATGGSIRGEMDLAVVTALPACGNGVDDDGDGLVDYPADPNCSSFEDPSELPDCSNGIDDDGDGATDYPDDVGCQSATSVREDPACSNGIDDDGDGKIDWNGGPNGEPPDPQCPNPYRNSEKPKSCGLGAELLLAAPLLRALARRRRRSRA